MRVSCTRGGEDCDVAHSTCSLAPGDLLSCSSIDLDAFLAAARGGARDRLSSGAAWRENSFWMQFVTVIEFDRILDLKAALPGDARLQKVHGMQEA